MVTPETPICQSCAMPFTTPEEFGTHADGSQHDEFCSYCFEDGEFTDPDLTLSHMVDFTAEMMVNDEGISESEAKQAARELLTPLRRWC